VEKAMDGPYPVSNCAPSNQPIVCADALRLEEASKNANEAIAFFIEGIPFPKSARIGSSTRTFRIVGRTQALGARGLPMFEQTPCQPRLLATH
jgi:hypothetical protein